MNKRRKKQVLVSNSRKREQNDINIAGDDYERNVETNEIDVDDDEDGDE